MNKYAVIIILSFFAYLSCSKQLKDMNVNLTTKGITGTTISIEDDETHNLFWADTLFFKHIESRTGFKDGTIIMSKVVDSSGNIVINAEPGIYVIIAARYSVQGSWIISIFDEKTVSYSLVELKAGETKIIPRIYTVSKRGNVLGNISEIQQLHRSIIGEQTNSTMYEYVLGHLNLNRHPDKEEQSKSKNDEENHKGTKKIEEFR